MIPRGSAQGPIASDSHLLQPGWRAGHRIIDGLSLHLVEAGDPAAPLVILLHGFPDFWWTWRYQIGPLAAAGYHVVAPDMRGYNRSDAPEGIAAYRLDRLGSDVLAIADAFGAQRFALVGHDWGAVIGWWVAARHPERVDRFVAIDGPHPDAWMKAVARHPGQALRSAYVAFFQLPGIPEAALGRFGFAGLRAAVRRGALPTTFEPGAIDTYVAAWSRPGSLSPMLNYYRALRYRSPGDPLPRIAPPTRVLWAADDPFLSPVVAAASVACCDQGRLEMFDGAGHWLHLDRPAAVAARLIDFLDQG